MLLDELHKVVGVRNVLQGEDVRMRSVSWDLDEPCEAAALVRPRTTEELAETVKLCGREARSIVVHGGRTSLVGGAIASRNDIVISLELMNTIENFNVENRTLTVGAGATLQSVQEAAADHGLFFAADFGARGTATIGGAISTNAGGLNVLRFGMMREQVLGLEVVLANGDILSMMHPVIKNNAGYDLKQLFIGSEGTLGVVTRAVVRLRFQAPAVETALLAVRSYHDAIALLHELETGLVGAVAAYELMWPAFYKRAARSDRSPPLPAGAPLYVLFETMSSGSESDHDKYLNILEEQMRKGRVLDAVIAGSENERLKLWAIRENFEALMDGGPTANFDISLSVEDIPEYLESVERGVGEEFPAAVVMPFGHLGDNNLHISINLPNRPQEELKAVKRIVYSCLDGFKASVSAEHGIGIDKKPFLHITRSSNEVLLMKQMKSLLDPDNILNPALIF